MSWAAARCVPDGRRPPRGPTPARTPGFGEGQGAGGGFGTGTAWDGHGKRPDRPVLVFGGGKNVVSAEFCGETP
ncbi:hypothetical protein [Streptomyces sp. SA15]|uniref:hypothetical protein n=1 Tax=Streptomyces sp. SA15 TaxID=934019 RepID=UPI00117D8159|nr:hypothetical protein [Streptomyces sp. SA15]